MAGSLHPSAADNEAERKRQEDARAAQAAARRAALARRPGSGKRARRCGCARLRRPGARGLGAGRC